jgi:hypothetical protein
MGLSSSWRNIHLGLIATQTRQRTFDPMAGEIRRRCKCNSLQSAIAIHRAQLSNSPTFWQPTSIPLPDRSSALRNLDPFR